MKNSPALQSFDPQAVGFRSGLEVHQQLLTDHKLFCRCPAGVYSDDYDAQALRHMRPTLSELGEYDGTALMEFKTKKDILYRLNKRSVCTYEMDDNPPFLINEQAVEIAMEIALLLNCSIVGELHVARKQYLDGSIPAGFQRTAIVGLNGWLPYKGRRIGVVQLAVEEDACREIRDRGHLRIYATDRLSMPLIEVVTAPDMRTPQEVAEVGWLIAETLRATGKIRRGLGSVRQDVNVSVAGGTRVEIKGVPRIPLFPSLTYFEAYRQHRLLALRDRMHRRGLDKETEAYKRFELGSELEHPLLEQARRDHQRIAAVVLRGMSGLLRWPIGPNRVFADDIAGRVRVIACLDHFPNLLHTDDRRPSALSTCDRQALKALTGMTADDCVVIVWGQPKDVETGLNEVEIRVREALVGIPNETRQRLPGGETDFERILPGPDRMYPDTDSPPLALPAARVKAIRDRLPEPPWTRQARYTEFGLPAHWMRSLLREPVRADAFDYALKVGIKPKLAGWITVELLKYRRRIQRGAAELNPTHIQALLDYIVDNKIPRAGIRLFIEAGARRGSTEWRRLADECNLNCADRNTIEAAVEDAYVNRHLIRTLQPEARRRCLTGIVIDKLNCLADGRMVADIVEGRLNAN